MNYFWIVVKHFLKCHSGLSVSYGLHPGPGFGFFLRCDNGKALFVRDRDWPKWDLQITFPVQYAHDLVEMLRSLTPEDPAVIVLNLNDRSGKNETANFQNRR